MSTSSWLSIIITVSPSIRGSEEVSPLTVIEGSLITLVCESSGIPPPSLTWRKDGKCVCRNTSTKELFHMDFVQWSECCHLCVPGSELKSDQRLRILSGGRQLQISSAARTDAASYTCTASSASGITSKEYSLQVYGTWVPPYLWHLVTKVISAVFLALIAGKLDLKNTKNELLFYMSGHISGVFKIASNFHKKSGTFLPF